MVRRTKGAVCGLSFPERRKHPEVVEGVSSSRDRDSMHASAKRTGGKRVRDDASAELREAFRILKQEREAQGLTLTDMQDRTGMSRSAISRLENDDRANPTMETLARYAKALGKDLTVTLTGR